MGCVGVQPINCSTGGKSPCFNSATCLDSHDDPGWNLGVCECSGPWTGRYCNISSSMHLEPAPFVTNYMYPIVHFAGVHPTNQIGLYTDSYSIAIVDHAKLLDVTINTVWGDNERSEWHPVNGFCLAWPSATRITDGRLPGRTEALLDRFEAALNVTMGSNYW